VARPKKHPLTSALEALGRDPKDVEHFIHEGARLEVFFRAPAIQVSEPANAGSPYARPATVPESYLGNGDINDLKPGDPEAPVEAWDLLGGRS
jgi:hypothetical protein